MSPNGDVPKWLKGADSKSARRRKACGGSNPSISAIRLNPGIVFLCRDFIILCSLLIIECLIFEKCIFLKIAFTLIVTLMPLRTLRTGQGHRRE